MEKTIKLIKDFPNIYQFCEGSLNRFVLSLRKGVFPYEYMDSWEKFNETALPPKKDFYNNLGSGHFEFWVRGPKETAWDMRTAAAGILGYEFYRMSRTGL